MELYGGTNSAINAVATDATAFVHRSSIFTIQFYASSPNMQPPYPQSGLTFVDGKRMMHMSFILCTYPVLYRYREQHCLEQPFKLELRVSVSQVLYIDVGMLF